MRETAFLKRIRLGAAPAECRLVSRSGTLRLDRTVALSGIALGLTNFSRLHCPQAVPSQHDNTPQLNKYSSANCKCLGHPESNATKTCFRIRTIMIDGKKLSEAFFIISFHYFIISEKPANYFREL